MTAPRRAAGSKQPPAGLRAPGTPAEALAAIKAAAKPSARKYKNVPIEINGIRFDSKKEAKRYDELRFMQRVNVIRDLEVHPRFPLVVNEQDCGTYVADFAYIDPETGERVIEDVKSAATRKLPTYRIKVRLVWALYGLRVREV